MYIFLIIWFLFLFAYIVFNIYGLVQVLAKRFKGDAIGLMVLIYLIIIFVIISASIFAISHLSWSQSLTEVFKI